MAEISHSILFDRERCVACVACVKACPTRAIRVRDDQVRVKTELCIDCGECIRACPHDAVSARTSSPSDLNKYEYTVAIPTTALFSQFGGDVRPSRVAHALTRIGFDAFYDMSWMCEMSGQAIDTYLSECRGPWPKISLTCPAIIRLVQIRYPDLLHNLVPIEVPRELTAKLIRRRFAHERGCRPEEIGIFYITPCSAIMHSIVCPVGLEESYLDGAFSVAEVYGPIRKALRELGDTVPSAGFSPRGLGWAMAGGESAMMRDANTLTISGVQDVTYVFDRIESGRFQTVDFIEAYICPDGCVSGPLLVEGRYRAKRNLREVLARLDRRSSVNEEKTRSLFREHFFDLEEKVRARAVKPLARDLRQAILLKHEKDRLLATFPAKDCAACGAPDCATLADDVLDGSASPGDCVFVRLERFAADSREPGTAAPTASRAEAGPRSAGPQGGDMSKEMLLLEVTCPNCGDLLTEGRKVRLGAYVKDTQQDGEVFLSAIFGDYGVESELEIPGGAVVEFRCPTCDVSLMLNTPCKLCGAPTGSLNLKTGGYLEFCSRRGCRGHALGGFGDIDQMISLVNRLFHTPHD